MSERLEEIKARTQKVVDYGGEIDHGDVAWLIEQAEHVQEMEWEKEEWLSGRFMSVKHSIIFKEIEQKNEMLKQQNERYREALYKLQDFVRRGEDECNIKQLIMMTTDDVLEESE